MLTIIKQALGITHSTQDTYLQHLIKETVDECESYTNNTNIPENIIEEIVIWKYNRLNSLGLSGENYTGVSYSYTNDYPENVVRELKRYRKVKTL